MFWIYSLLGGLKMGKPKLKKEIGLFTATALVDGIWDIYASSQFS